jgi:hypothetical protein
MTGKIQVYTCPTCKLRLVNHSQSEIAAHMLTAHRKGLNSLTAERQGAKRKKKQAGRFFSKKAKAQKRLLAEALEENRRLKKKLETVTKAAPPPRQLHPFYDSPAWRTLRVRILYRDGRICALCRATQGEMHVDHIKPRSRFPELELDPSNLRVLCRACNLGKSAFLEEELKENS